jgi:hypothetical protein
MIFKRIISTALSAVLLPAVLFAEAPVLDLSHPYSSLPAEADAGTAPIRQEWRGERLEYEIYWGLINVGSAYLHIDRIVTVDGRPAYHIISGAKSSSFIKNFYTVSDVNESWMDVADLFSFGYSKNIREGGYMVNEWVAFDYSSMTFRGERMNKKREVSAVSGELPGRVSDVLSALYLVRTMDLSPDSSRTISVNTKRTWDMNIKFKKREKESTSYGKYKCMVVEPQLGDDGLFVAKQGKRMLVWITDDELRLPLILKAEIFIGSVTAKLVKRRQD